MNVRSDVLKRINKKLEQEQVYLKQKLYTNKRKIAELVYEQTVMKREIAELHKLKKLVPNPVKKVEGE